MTSGLLLQISFPPVHISWISCVALVPVLWALRKENSAPSWGLCGAVVGLIWHSVVPYSLASWQTSLQLGAWAVGGFVAAAAFYCARVVMPLLPMSLRWCAVPMAWVALTTVTSEYVTPIYITGALPIELPELVAATSTVGIAVLELIVVALSSSLASLDARTVGVVWGASAAVILVALATAGSDRTSSAVRIHAIEPSIPHATHNRASWSLQERRLIEDRLDALTVAALEDDAEVVVWPEGGNGLFNARLDRRRSAFARMLKGRSATVIAPSPDLQPDGSRHNSVVVFRSDGTVAVASRKRRVVPIAESKYDVGQTGLVETPLGMFAVPICFDSVFHSDLAEQVDDGADAIIVVSDDSSFELGFLTEWHVQYSALAAAAVRRPMLFLSNSGPAIVVDEYGRLSQGSMEAQGPAVTAFQLGRATTPAPIGCVVHRLTMLVAAMLLVVGLAYQGVRRGVAAREEAAFRWVMIPRYCFVGLLGAGAIVTGLVLQLVTTAVAREVPLLAATRIGSAATIPDEISPLFRQSSELTCGAAAIAYSLTLLGAEVFEEDFVSSQPPAAETGLSFADLAEFARDQGFDAAGVETTFEDLGTVPLPAIAHLGIGHFVVIVSVGREDCFVFDPATGRLGNVRRNEFERLWSGRLLVISTQ